MSVTKKRNHPEAEAVDQWHKSGLHRRMCKLTDQIRQNPQFQERLQLLKRTFPFQYSQGNVNPHRKEWMTFCDKEGVSLLMLEMFDVVEARKPYMIDEELIFYPIEKKQFQRLRLNFESIIPRLIKAGYLTRDFVPVLSKQLSIVLKDFQKIFPDHSNDQMEKILGILANNYISRPQIKVLAPITGREHADLWHLRQLSNDPFLGKVLQRSGRPANSHIHKRNREIRAKYKALLQKMKRRWTADRVIQEMHDTMYPALTVGTLARIARSKI